MQILCRTTAPISRYMTEKIQLEAERIVSGTTKLVAINKLYQELGWLKLSAITKLCWELGWLKVSAINKLYQELGWLKLSERRKLHKLFVFHKMENGHNCPIIWLIWFYPVLEMIPLTVFTMLIIINRSMPHLDYILIHFFHLQFGSGTVFQMIWNHPRLEHHLNINLKKILRKSLNIKESLA